MLRGRLLMFGVGFLMLVGAAKAGAATIKVTTTFDDQQQGDGQCSLRKAILDVNSPGSSQTDCAPAAFGANTIVLGAAGYQLGGGSTTPGQLTVASTVKNLTITGASASGTTIDAGPLHDRAFMISGGAGVTITNLTIVNASAQSQTGQVVSGPNGGAIFNQGTLTLSNAAITNSHAGSGGGDGSEAGFPGGTGGSGGAIYNTGALTLNGATLASNTAGNGGTGGGGLQGSCGTHSFDAGDGGAGGTGGAIENAGGTLTVIGSTIRGNTAGNGGAGGNGATGQTGCSSTGVGGNGGNGGPGANGGGIWSDGASLTVTNSTFASNSAGAGGAGGNGGPASSGSSAPGGNGGAGGIGGGAGGIGAANPSSASLLQVTAAGNNAGAGGTGADGGNGSPSGTAGAAGLGGSGGGVLAQGSAITVRNSLLALSGGGNCSGPVQDGGFNLSFGDSSCPSTFASGDPNLGPLEDNGGPAATISLQQGSAAIGQIPPAGANCPATDERGAPRPSGSSSSKCDIGAYQVVAPVGVTQPATNIGLTGATVNASVIPYAGAGQAAVVFQYGTSTKYGKTTGIAHLGGVTATPVTTRLSGLKPNTVYHYRVVVIAMDGTAAGKDVTFTTSVTPAITGLSISPKPVSASRGTTISYRDSRIATTTLTAFRCAQVKRGRCVRWNRFASFTRKDAAGPNKVTIKRRFGSRALQKGNYRLELSPRSNGKTGKTVTATFKVN